MLKKYGELIARLLENLTDGKGDVTLLECLRIAGNGILLMVVLLLFLGVFSGAFVLPTKVYKALMKPLNIKLGNLLKKEDSSEELIESIRKAVIFRKVAFWLLFVVVYIPVAIPMALYLISLLCG